MTDGGAALAALLRQRRVDPADPRVELAVPLLQDEAGSLAELADQIAALLRWAPPPAAAWGPALSPGLIRRALAAVRATVLEAPELDAAAAAAALERAVHLSGLGRLTLRHAVRLALTGRSRGPDLARLIAVLGRDEVERRLGRGLDRHGLGRLA